MVQFIFLIERTPGYISALKFYFPPPTITSKKYGGGNLLRCTHAHSGTCYTCTQWYLLHLHTVVLATLPLSGSCTQWYLLHLHIVVLATLAHSGSCTHSGVGYTSTLWYWLHQHTVVLATHSHGGTCYGRSLWCWRH
jgi:hypothetical protein